MVSDHGDCEHWRGLLAIEAVGQLDDSDRAALLEHLQGCAACSADRSELASTVSALALAERAFLDHGASLENLPPLPVASPATPDAAPAQRRSDAGDHGARGLARSRWTLRRGLIGASAAAAAAVIVTAGLLGALGGGTAPPQPIPALTVALHGGSGSYGTARLFHKSWGTSIELDDHVTSPPQVFTVSMRTGYGRPWLAGTYWSATGTDVRVTLGCALSLSDIRGVTVTDSNGHVVLQS